MTCDFPIVGDFKEQKLLAAEEFIERGFGNPRVRRQHIQRGFFNPGADGVFARAFLQPFADGVALLGGEGLRHGRASFVLSSKGFRPFGVRFTDYLLIVTVPFMPGSSALPAGQGDANVEIGRVLLLRADGVDLGDRADEGFALEGVERVGQRVADGDAVQVELIHLGAQLQRAHVRHLAQKLAAVDLRAGDSIHQRDDAALRRRRRCGRRSSRSARPPARRAGRRPPPCRPA